MGYKSILVHVDDSSRAAVRIGVAVALALRHDAHLVGAAFTGVARAAYPTFPAEDDAGFMLHLEVLREQGREALSAFVRQADDSGLAAREARVIDDHAAAGLCQLARAADLVVLGQAPPDAAPLMADFPGQVVLGAGRPVLVIPHAGQPLTPGEQVLVAWDGSREASWALAAALPLLRHASTVQLVGFERAESERAARDAAAVDLRGWLARHGILAEFALHPLGAGRHQAVADALLSLATDLSADLIVMGAYGRSRLRETLMGGVTRSLLASMTIPVLMAH